jgi:serine phosphatase RsbU (regulator of sigma subunit)
MDKKGRMYGQERLVSVIKGHKDLPSDKLLKAIEKDVRNFEPRSTQHDDITLIVARVV